MMSDSERAGGDELLAIPRLAERVGVTPRVLRYWEEQGLISPTREHGKLRYSPRDVAIAALIRKLLEAGAGVEGVRMLKRLAERDIRRSSSAGDETALIEAALQILYQRKAFREETGMDEEHYPEGKPPPPPRPRAAARHAALGLPADLGTKGRWPTPRDQNRSALTSLEGCSSRRLPAWLPLTHDASHPHALAFVTPAGPFIDDAARAVPCPGPEPDCRRTM